MNRLQKKCLIATAGFHLLLVLVILFGAAFFVHHEEPDETQPIDMIPSILIDAKLASGVKVATPPAPQPIVQPPTPPQPQPTPVPPQPQPAPTLVDEVKKFFTPTPEKLPPEDTKPVDNLEKIIKPHVVKVDLKPVVHNVPKNSTVQNSQNNSNHQKPQPNFKQIAQNLKDSLSSATEINLPGNSSVAYANYGAAVVSAYHQAWTPPDNMVAAEAVVRFSVTIARDGNVISSRIITSSGDSSVDNAVQRMLDRVSFIGEFPDDSKDRQRTYNIDFNATRTSTL